MASFLRLVHIVTGEVLTFDLDKLPRFCAVSHVWKEGLFQAGVPFAQCRGSTVLRSMLDETIRDVEFYWIDTVCIDQDDPEDKERQIPLMERIYSQAEVVVITLGLVLGVTQKDIDELESSVREACEMDKNGTYREHGLFWQRRDGRAIIGRAMTMLSRLVISDWATRVWTMQEYALARDIIWVGTDAQAFRVSNRTLVALPSICNQLSIAECIGGGYARLYNCIMGMATFREQGIDRTRVMELLGSRGASVPQDEVYGAMAVTRVIIPIDYTMPRELVWLAWCEQSVLEGELRMALLPTFPGSHVDEQYRNCAFPDFAVRSLSSSSSPITAVRPVLGPSVAEGTVSMYGRRAGICKFVRRLDPVIEDPEIGILRDITLSMYTEGIWRRAFEIATAFGCGFFTKHQTRNIAILLYLNYGQARHILRTRAWNKFKVRFANDEQAFDFQNFMLLQSEVMPYINEGLPYLIKIKGAGTVTYTMCSMRQAPSQEQYLAIDFQAEAAPGRVSLMLVTRQSDAAAYHKEAMTGVVHICDNAHNETAFNHLKLTSAAEYQYFEVGGRKCTTCNPKKAG